MYYTDIALLFHTLRSHGHNCDHVTNANAEAVHRVSLAGVKAKGKRGRTVTLLSFAYTQTIVCLYANDCSAILKSKRTPARRSASCGCSRNNPQAVSSRVSSHFWDEHIQGSFHPHP